MDTVKAAIQLSLWAGCGLRERDAGLLVVGLAPGSMEPTRPAVRLLGPCGRILIRLCIVSALRVARNRRIVAMDCG
ncbi:MAG: hypothetical protein CM1200mP41_35320 [Gammaproteobacteria bacterium]|nr:MAG: hypothetical protein CM1200mP41_35320 [Gammaproteobacteria bacterium]